MYEDPRTAALRAWLARVLQQGPAPVSASALRLTPLAGDASARRYFRVHTPAKSYIGVDAPPAREDINAFIAVAALLTRYGLPVPPILASDRQQGFLCVGDFGKRTLAQQLNANNANQLYTCALENLVAMQQLPMPALVSLPHYTEALLLTELSYFETWFLGDYQGMSLDDDLCNTLTTVFSQLVDSALSQPQAFVHRDYHSRNLMRLSTGAIGILDFQDAVVGPVSYDVVSLLRDAYVDWPPHVVNRWQAYYYRRAQEVGILPAGYSFAQFTQHFDWMGVQRHLKILGIFCRLYRRDNKPQYLCYLPRIYRYLTTVCQRYDALQPLFVLIDRIARLSQPPLPAESHA